MINLLQHKNKKAATMQGWTEGIGLMVIFVIVLGVIIVGMNDLYSKDYEIVGLETDSYSAALQSYEASQEEKIVGGEVDFESNNPISLKTSWDIIVGTVKLVWNFITGQWLQTILVDYLHLGGIGYTIYLILRGLLFIALGFIVLRIIFRIKT